MAAQPHRYVLLLRGINVGGRNKLSMAELRRLCESIGCTDVATYIQSGNVVLDSALTADDLCHQVQAAITAAVGFTPTAVLRRPVDLDRVVQTHPFPDADGDKIHVGFMSSPPSKKAVADLADVDHPPEEFAVRGAEIYLHLPNGMGRSKLATVPFEKRLGVAITMRNWRTVNKLHDMGTTR